MYRHLVRLAIGVGAAGALILPATANAANTAPITRYASPGASNAADASCTTAGYGTIQAAVNASASGDSVVICAGTYAEQVTITTSNLTLTGQGLANIQPNTAAVNATDLDSTQPIVAILAVESPAKGVQVSGLTIDGSLIESSVDGCSQDLVGVLYQASAGSATASLKHLTVENTTPTSSGCGSGLGILAQAGTTGNAIANVSIANNSVVGYGKNGITCSDLGITCTITSNNITTSATGAVAQNGVQMGFGASGSVSKNTISGNNWTGTATDTANPQIQSDYAAGVLLYAAGINAAGATTSSTLVSNNHLSNNQIGVEVVDSAASVMGNSILENPGITGSIGVYGVGCDAYCGYFNDNNGASLDSAAAANQVIAVTKNTINFASPAPSASYGIWLGDNSWAAASGYYAPAGSESVTVSGRAISNVTHLLVIDSGASIA